MPVIAGNWKMNKGPRAARDFVAEFTSRYAPEDQSTVILIPPSISISPVVEALGSRRDINVGVQNIHWEKSGAFTGEVSADMAMEAGARYALVGHSERRHTFGESDHEVRQKLHAALQAGLRAILCVGETLDQRQAGHLERVITAQLRTGIEGLTEHQAHAFMVAYEPVWAIGTGVTATPADASEAHSILRSLLTARMADAANSIPILYGGSVNVENAPQLLAAEGVGGLLIGGASLDAEGFATICRQAAQEFAA